MSLNYFNFYKNFLWEDVIVVFLLYNFFKYLIMCAMVELIWPTQFFNRRHNIGYNIHKFRTYSEVLVKLRNSNKRYSVFSYYFNRYFFMYLYT
jgi:hypothetical protein